MAADETQTTLLEQAKSGDREAFDKLTGPLRARLVAFVRSRLGYVLRGKLEPEDVVQEASLKAFESIGGFRGADEESLWSWLTSISEHLIRNASRKRSFRESSLFLETPGKEVSPSQGLRRKERLDRLQGSLSRLKPEQREVLLLAKIEGLKAKEIAQRLGRSEAGVRQTISRALRTLREDFGDTESLHLPARALNEGSDDAAG